MEGSIPAHDPSQLRVGDDERHRVAEILRRAAGEGRIDLGELDDRLGAVYAAKTYGELEPITHDLPEHPGRLAPALSSAPVPATHRAAAPDGAVKPERHVAVVSEFQRKGVWTAPPALTVTAVIGGITLDFREAVFAASECVLTINAFVGGATVTVGPEVRVVMEGTAFVGAYTGPGGGEQARPDSPTLRIRGLAVIGGIEVRRKNRA